MVKVELGDEVQDQLTGFTGAATGRAEYLTGCVQIQIVATNHKTTIKTPEECWIDEQRLKIITPGYVKLAEKAVKQAPAGPQNVPPARNP